MSGSERRAALVSEVSKIGEIFESKIRRRINLVPKKFAQLKIKDILEVESDHKIKIYELISDIKKLHQEQQSKSSQHDKMEDEIAELNKKRVENVKKYKKRKESIAQSGRVSKPRLVRK